MPVAPCQTLQNSAQHSESKHTWRTLHTPIHRTRPKPIHNVSSPSFQVTSAPLGFYTWRVLQFGDAERTRSDTGFPFFFRFIIYTTYQNRSPKQENQRPHSLISRGKSNLNPSGLCIHTTDDDFLPSPHCRRLPRSLHSLPTTMPVYLFCSSILWTPTFRFPAF